MTAVYIAAKTDPWDSDTATTDPERAEVGSRPIGEIVPIVEGSDVVVDTRWSLPMRLVTGLGPNFADECIHPRTIHPRTLLARTALAALVEPLGDCPRCGKPKRLCRRAKGIAPTCGARFAHA